MDEVQKQPEGQPVTPPHRLPDFSRMRAGRRARALFLLAGFFLAVGLAWGIWWVTVLRYAESTDDAYAAGNTVTVMPQVAGRVTAVLADDTDLVEAGQALVPIDPVDARLAYEHALVSLATAVRETCKLEAELRQSEANMAMRKIDLQRQQGNLERRQLLIRDKAVRKEEFIHSAEDVATARHALAVAEAQRNALTAVLLDTPVDGQPAVREAAAAVRERWLDLQRATVRSPVRGQVARRAVQVGEYVTPGKALLAVVPLDSLWVDANFKESQLRRMRIGQPALVRADMYGGSVTYHGTVQGFAAGTGSVFSLLPPQNATGNWIKVVQRVPVRIAIPEDELRAHPLLVGLSVTVEVDTVGLSVTVEVDTKDQDGPMLLTAPRPEPPASLAAQTPPVDFAPVDERIRAVIAANTQAGSAATHQAGL